MGILRNKRLKNKTRIRFSEKLFIFLAAFSIIPVIILGIIAYTMSRSISLSNLESHVKTTVSNAAQSLDRCLGEYQTGLDYFCNDKDVVGILASGKPNNKVIYQKIYLLLSGKQQTVQMHVIPADGSYSISTSELPDDYNIKRYPNWGIFRALKNTNGSVLYPNHFISTTGHEYCLTVAHTIVDPDGKIIGYAIIDLPPEAFKDALAQANEQYPVSYTVYDSNNYILYSPTSGGSFLSQDCLAYINKSLDSGSYYSDDKQLTVWNTTPDPNSFGVMAVAQARYITDSIIYLVFTTVSIAMITILLLLVLLPFIIQALTKPLTRIVHTMTQIQNGNTLARVPVSTQDEFGFIGSNLNKTLDKMDELYRINLERQDSLRVAELKALYSQINPHFLYNTLDSIKWLAKLNHTDDIAVMVSQLGHMLQYTIHNQKNLIAIADEISFVNSYLAIQKLRYGDKFDVEFQVDDDILQCIIPKLIIQPLVEDAIIHGIENKIGTAHLKIRGICEQDTIRFEVSDNGVGMSLEKLAEIQRQINEPMSDHTIGLSNVNKRIKLYYGDDYGLTINSRENVGTSMMITIPRLDLKPPVSTD